MAQATIDSPRISESPSTPVHSFPFVTLPGMLRYATSTYRRANALSYPNGKDWISWSHVELARNVRRLALGLRDMGLGKGEAVGLVAPSSPWWMAVDLAIQAAGGITVPLFKRISVESFTHEIKDSGMRTLFVGNPEEMPMAFEHSAGLKHLVSFWYSGTHPDFDRLMARGEELEREQPDLFDRLCDSVSPKDLATIIYTSGSTGLPKGVELRQESLVSQVKGCAARLPMASDTDVALSTLPLEHIFERMVMSTYIANGVPVYFVDDPKRVAAYMATVRPTIMTVVPRILEKVAAHFREAGDSAPGIKGAVARAALTRAAKKPVDGSSSPLDPVYRAAVYRRMYEALGGRLHMLISGAAKLDPRVACMLVNIGIPIYEGYGLTEAAPVISVNYPGHRKLGSVGPIFPDVEVRIAEDGEILARGPNIMQGYHNNLQATEAAITKDGWLHTGDLGEVDADGYLFIKGRKKEMFKKSTGEYVPPAPIEYELSQIPFVDTALIVADNRTVVTALLFPDLQKLPAYKARFGLGDMPDGEFLKSDFLRHETQQNIDQINAHLHHCERVERFTIMDHPAGIESGELTPTLKVRRFYIEEQYKDYIDAMYGSVGGWK